MNNILHLKGQFNQKSNSSRPGAPKLPRFATINANKLINLKRNLINLKSFWENNNYLDGALISAYYIKLAAKSNRVRRLLSVDSSHANNSIVGAKFNDSKNKHIITHYISIKAITNSIDLLKKSIEILNQEFNGEINDEVFNNQKTYREINFQKYEIAKTTFQQVVVDSYYVGKFDIEESDIDVNKESIITIYKTDKDTQDVLERIGIRVPKFKVLNKTTVLLDPIQLDILKKRAPYLIAMATVDLNKIAISNSKRTNDSIKIEIPKPSNEPTIGVIDTLFNEDVYFSEWVDFHNKLDRNIPIDENDYLHGTQVSSIVVDGPTLNPTLDDGCGRFKVKHFGVATNKNFHSFTIIRKIREIIADNRNIRVWNISLGSEDEINNNFISAEAAVLDEIQYEYDVVFVIAGTNNEFNGKTKRIGAPADSINGIVVNSVTNNNKPVDYSRYGPALSFFNKPDISYYGGTTKTPLNAYSSNSSGVSLVSGTSFAAPWIARKMSYLIDILGLSKEVAKALLIDSAIGWEKDNDFEKLSLLGYGVVPIKIEDIVKSAKNEIRFILNGTSEKYDTYTYNIPVPIQNETYPYIARATLCYFPKCSRNQGVDYTNTELDIYFGRINNKGQIDSVNKNRQSLENAAEYLTEEDLRKEYRKWDNVKHISEEILTRARPRKVYDNPMWGLSIKTKERLNNRDGEGISFGIVITLREMHGVNRIEEFIQQCNLRGWLVNTIDIESRIDIYESLHEDLELE